MNAEFLRVAARVRYWEDATVDGVEDSDGNRIPCRIGDLWCPVIRLDSGVVQNWPPDVAADVHYKVADEGEYWLQDGDGHDVAKWGSYYVPDAYLCHGDRGYGDYIILRIDTDGRIKDYRRPTVEARQWEPVTR